MPIPPLEPYRFVCSQCDWEGPIQVSDVICGPLDCPHCHIPLVHKSVTKFDMTAQWLKSLNILKR